MSEGGSAKCLLSSGRNFSGRADIEPRSVEGTVACHFIESSTSTAVPPVLILTEVCLVRALP